MRSLFRCRVLSGKAYSQRLSCCRVDAFSDRLRLEMLEARILLNVAPVASDDAFSVREDVGLVLTDQPRLEITRIDQRSTGVAYDPIDDVLYLAVPDDLTQNSGTLTTIDPTNGEVLDSIAVVGDPGELVMAADDRTLYAVMNGRRDVQPLDLDTESLDERIYMPGDREIRSSSILPLPGRTKTFIVSLYISAFNTSGGVMVYENGVPLERQIGGGPDIIAVDETGLNGYGYHIISTAFDFYELNVLEDGVEIAQTYPWGSVLRNFGVGKLRAAAGKLFTNRGEILSVETLRNVGSFRGGANFHVVAEEGRLYSVESDRGDHTIRAYDLETLALVGSAEIFDVPGASYDLTRIGSDGIAFRTEDEIVLVRSDELFGILNRGVLRNDFDPDGDPLTVELVSDVQHGELTLNTNGVFQYIPAANYYGSDAFSYRVSDGTLFSNTATVSIEVTPVNDPPSANSDTYQAFEDMPLEINAENGLLANDSDVENDELLASLVVPPVQGSVEVNADGSFAYTPNPDFQGSDQFLYRLFDGAAYSSPAIVTIDVEPSGDPPVAVDDTFVVQEDVGLTISPEPVLDVVRVNQAVGGIIYDPMDDVLFVSVPEDAAEFGGTLSAIDPNTGRLLNSVDVAGDPGYLVISPDDRVIHIVLDDNRVVQPYDLRTRNTGSTVTMPGTGNDTRSINDIYPLAGRPSAFIVSLEYDNYNSAGGVIVYENGTALGRKIGGGVGSGGPVILAIGDTSDRAYGYYNLSTIFEFYEVDILHDGAEIDVYHPWGSVLSGFNVNELRVADNKLFTNRGEIVDLDSFAHIGSFEGGQSFVASADEGRLYSVESNEDNETHIVRAYDLKSLDLIAAANIENVPGTALDLTRYGADGVAFRTENEIVFVRSDELFGISSYGVLRNDYDPDGQDLQVALVEGPQHGILQLNRDGTFTYLPELNYWGVDSFKYTVTDGVFTSNIATATIEVAPVNDPADARDDTYLLPFGGNELRVTAVDGVLSNDQDNVEFDPLTANLVDPPQTGSVVLNSDGSFVYTADPAFDFTDSFTYLANDGQSDSELATVTIEWDIPRIDVGEVPLRPHTPNQEVSIHVSGGASVAGLNLFLQVGDGGPELSNYGVPAGTDGPAITGVDLKTGTIFETVSDPQVDQPGIPQVATTAIAISEGGQSVLADGLLATVTMDTTGFFEGSWDLLLADVLPFAALSGPFTTDFAGIPAHITNGRLVIRETEVVGRHLFYDGSSFADALATDKQPLFPGETATFANYSSYSRGLNGLAMDVANLLAPPTLDDFEFRMGRHGDLSSWTVAPAPQEFSVLSGAGLDGADRVVIRWQDEAIFNQWLEVTMLPGVETGLAHADVFYFGNAPGDTGDSSTNALVNATDVVRTRDNKKGPFNPPAIDDPYDFNRDGLVNATDVIFARDHITSPFTALQLITPVPTPAAGALRTPRAPLPIRRALAAAIDEDNDTVPVENRVIHLAADEAEDATAPTQQFDRRGLKWIRARTQRLPTAAQDANYVSALDDLFADVAEWIGGAWEK